MKKIIGIVTPILLLILPYLLFVVLSVGMGRPDRDSSGAYIMAGDSRLQMTQTAICIVYVVVVLLNVVWVICQTAAGTSAQTLLLWDMLMKLCYIPYYLLAALMVLAGFATFHVWRSRNYRRDVDCGRPVFDTAVHLWTVRLHPGVQ